MLITDMRLKKVKKGNMEIMVVGMVLLDFNFIRLPRCNSAEGSQPYLQSQPSFEKNQLVMIVIMFLGVFYSNKSKFI